MSQGPVIAAEGFRFPRDVEGWLTETEGRALAQLASGKRVLEIGSYCGGSTICLAQTADSVTSIDPHDGRGTPAPRDTFQDFLSNLKRYGVDGKVDVRRGTLAAHTLRKFAVKFDLAFIDDAHDRDSVRASIGHALQLLAPGGLLAFHDYGNEPGVTAAVDELIEDGAELLATHGSIAVVKASREAPKADLPVIAVAMPSRDAWVCREALLAMEHPVSRPARVIGVYVPPCPLLNHNFNQVWAAALNCRKMQGATHFAMIHNDVCPESGWLTTLYDELLATDADVVSAVIPLKDDRGLTSTAVYDGEPWKRRRLTLAEVAELPDTFSAEDAGGKLLLNTGLWICDLRREWVDELCFHSAERITVNEQGRYVADVIPEDWLWSHWLNERGASLYATSKVKVNHVGTHAFTSATPWGAWKTDEDYAITVANNGMEAIA